jgi:ELWxxDGT repeat protein
MKKSCWVIVTAMLASPTFGVDLVSDVNAVPLVEHTGGGGFGISAQTNGGIVFFVQDQAHGLEPWVTDGTPAGTRLLKDIHPGPSSCGVEMVTATNGMVFFIADDGTNGLELWRSDGTADGTRMVANIGPGSANGAGGVVVGGGSFPVINNVLYFGGNDGVTGDELWRTDGTAAGTYRLSDGLPGAASLTPYDFRVVGTRLYFRGDAGVPATALWTSDGTLAGTRDVGVQQFAGTTMGPFWVAGDTVFFSLTDSSHGRELWRATASGAASLVADLNSGPGDSEPEPIAVMNDASLLFRAYTSSGGLAMRLMRVRGNGDPTKVLDSLPGDITRAEMAPNGVLINFYTPITGDLPLFFTDGTSAGSGFVNSELRFSIGTNETVSAGGYLYFFARMGFGAPSNIWRTDGTRASLTQFVTLDTPVQSEQLVLSNGKFYFMNGRFTDPDHGYELWTSDGTPAGTKLFKEFVPGPGPASVDIHTLGNRLLLGVFDEQSAVEPWVSDGTQANTVRLVDLTASYVTGSSEPEVLGNVGARTLFRADDGVHGYEIWATDGTGAGTRILTNQPDGAGFGSSNGRIVMNGQILFAGEGPAGTELWRTDGTAGGTFLVKDITPGSGSSELRLYDGVVLNGVAYFIANDGAHGLELWRSDGTDAGTWLVVDLVPGTTEAGITLLHSAASGRLFIRINGDPPFLYSSDGTAAGTVLVTNTLNVNSQGDFVFQNRVCFRAAVINDPVAEFYCSTGAAGNAVRLTDFHSMGVSPISHAVLLNGQLLISCHDYNGTGKGGMYIGDGTPAGLTKISDQKFESGVLMNGDTRFAFFKLDTTFSGVKDIWVTDGTADGTRSMLTGSSVVRANILEGLLEAVNNSVIFDVIDPVKGPVVWKSDGTAVGTRFLFDVDPTGDNADRPPAQFVRNGSRIYFSSTGAEVGNELWSFNATNPNATDDEATTAFNTAASINVAANDADFDSALTAPTIEIVTQPANGTVVANTGAGSLTYTPNNSFAGLDTFVYRVLDSAGNPSNGASVSVTVKAAPSNTAPGTAPSAPSNPPPSNPPPSGGGGSGGGGGGALGFELLLLGLLAIYNARRLRSPRDGRNRTTR